MKEKTNREVLAAFEKMEEEYKRNNALDRAKELYMVMAELLWEEATEDTFQHTDNSDVLRRYEEAAKNY